MASRAPRPAKHNFHNGVYFGTLKNGKCHGKGVFSWDSGEFYFGEWELNKMHGEGIFFFAYGGVIKGQFYKSKINGAAILKFPNGDVYEGFWRHGKLDGKCFKYFLHDKTWALCIYENGLYRSCLNRGKGTPNINFEEKLTDNIEIDSSINTGVHISMVPFMDGGKYYGSIQDENADGLGFTAHPSGAYDAGFYENGVIDGLGRISFPGGNFYDGEMKEGQFEGEGFFYKKDTNRWIFGNFKEGQCVSVLEKGSGVPFEEICAWKGRRRRGNSQPFYILNNMFFVPVIADSKDKKGKKKTQRFVGLKRAPSVTNDSQFITDINQVLLSTPDPNLGTLESQYESQGTPASHLLLPTSPTQAQHTFNTGEMSNKSEANDAKALAARVQDNIEKNWDFFTTSAAQQQATEEPVGKGSPQPGARKLNQAQMQQQQQQPQRQFGRSSTYQEPEAPKMLNTQKSAGSLLKGKTMTLERQKTGPVESIYTATLKTTKVKDGSGSGQSTGKSAGKSPLNQDFSGEPQQIPEKKPSRKSGSSTGSLGILRDKKGMSPQNKTQNKISSREFLNNAGVNEDTLELDFRNDYNTHSIEEAGGFGETPPGGTGHSGQGGKSPAFQYWQRSETPNEEDQLFGPTKNYGQTLNKEDQAHGRFASISSVNSHQPIKPHLFEGTRESSLIELGIVGGRKSTGEEEDVKEQEEGGVKKKLRLRTGEEEDDDDEEEENSAIQERREEEEFTPKASTKRSMKFGNKGLSSVGERSLSQETSPSVKSKRLLVDKRRTEESEAGKQEGGQATGGLSHRKWLDEFEGQHDELEKSGKIDSSFNSPEKSVSSPEKILRSARSVERILDLQKTPGPITGEDEDSRREGREGNKSDIFGQGKEIVSPLVKREMETEEDEDMIIKRIEENLLLIGKEKKPPVPPLVGPGEDEFREHLRKRAQSGQKQQAEEKEKAAKDAEEGSDNLQEKAQNEEEEAKVRSLGHLDEDNSAKIVTFGRIIVPSDREFALENEKKGQGEGGESSLNKSRVSKASKASKDISQEEIKENKEEEDQEETNKDVINEATEEMLLSSQRKREEEEVKSKLIVKGEAGAEAKDEFSGGLNTLQALEQRQKEYEEEASKGALPTSLERLEGEGKEELEMDDIGAVRETEEGIQKIKETEEDYQESIDRDVTIEKMTEAERRRLMLSGDFTAEGNKTLERLGDEEGGDMEKILSQNLLKGSQGGSHGGSQEIKSKGSIGESLKQEFPGVKKQMTYEFDDSEENRENREAEEAKKKEAEEIENKAKEGKEGKTPRKGRKSKGEAVDGDGDSEDSFRTANSPDNTEDKLNELEEEEGEKAEDYIVEDFGQNQDEEENQEKIKRAGQRQGAGYIMIEDQNGEGNGSSSQQEISARKTFVDRAVGNDTEPNEEDVQAEEEAHPAMLHKDTQSPELTARDLQEIRKSYADVNVQFPEFSPEENSNKNIGSQPVQQHGHRNPGQEIAVDYSILENSQRKKNKYELDLQYGFAESYENPNSSRPHSRLASPYREEAGSPSNRKASTIKKEGEVDGQIRSPPIYIVSHVVSRYGSAPGSQDEIVDKISKTLSHEIDQIFNESLSASIKRLASAEPSSLPNSHRQRLPSSSKDLEPQIIIVSPDRVHEEIEEAITRSAKPQEGDENIGRLPEDEIQETTAQEKQIAEQILGKTIPEEQNEETTHLSQGQEEIAKENNEALAAVQDQDKDKSQEDPKESQQQLQEEEQSLNQDEASRHLSHDESQRQGRFVNTAKSPQRETVESGFSSPIQSNQNTPLKNNSNLTISPGRFASPSGLRMAGSPTNLDYGIPNQKTDPLQARPPRSRKSASKNDTPVTVNGQPSLSSPLRQMDLFPRTSEPNTPNHAENGVSTPIVASVDIIKEEEEAPIDTENKREETPLVSVTSELGGNQNAPISSFPGPMNSSENTALLTVPLHAAQDNLYSNQSELDPTPTFTTSQNRPNRFSRNSPEAADDEELAKRSESPVPINILRQEYEAKTPEPKQTADDLNSSSSMIYKTPENEIRRIPENYEEIEDENFFTPVDSHRKRYMYPNTPLAKIEEGDEEGSMANTASKLQQDTANSLVYSPFSTKRSPIRSSPGRYNSARQTILSMNNFKNSGKKYYNAPEIMKPDVRNSEDVLEPIGVGAKKFAKTTPKKFDNHYLTTSPNKQGYHFGSPH